MLPEAILFMTRGCLEQQVGVTPPMPGAEFAAVMGQNTLIHMRCFWPTKSFFILAFMLERAPYGKRKGSFTCHLQ